jgi:hypothetical protein
MEAQIKQDHMTSIKQFKCQTCGKLKASDQFYESHTSKASDQSRASPHCIECNTEAVRLSRYRTQIKREGVAAFLKSMRQKEQQLATMTQALSEVKV